MEDLEKYLQNLRNCDPVVSFAAYGELIRDFRESGKKELLENTAIRERDPNLRAILFSALAAIGMRVEPGELFPSLDMLFGLLREPGKDDLCLSLLLQRVGESESPGILSILREQELSGFSIQVLPTIMGAFERFGSADDSSLVLPFLSHSAPEVVSAAARFAMKFEPARMWDSVISLLISPNPRIRAVGVGTLAEWDLPEASRHLEAMFLGTEPEEFEAARECLVGLPLGARFPILLRVIAIEDDPRRLTILFEEGIPVFDQGMLPGLTGIHERSSGEKKRMLSGLLERLAESAFRTGRISASPKSYLEDLTRKFHQARDLQISEQNRVARLLPDSGAPGAPPHPTPVEVPPKEIPSGAPQPADPMPTPSNPESEGTGMGLSQEERLRFLSRLDQPAWGRLKEGIVTQLPKMTRDEILTLALVLGRVGSPADVPILQPLLRNPDPLIVTASLESLARLDPPSLRDLMSDLLRHGNEEVRATALHVFSMFDKKRALAEVEDMAFSSNRRSRALAIFSMGHFDFPSVRDLVIKCLETEKENDNLLQMGVIIKANIDQELFFELLRLEGGVSEAVSETFRRIIQEAGEKLVGSGTAGFHDVESLRGEWRRKHERRESPPDHSLGRIRELRKAQPKPGGKNQRNAQAVLRTFPPGLPKLALVLVVFLAFFWFLVSRRPPPVKNRPSMNVKSYLEDPTLVFEEKVLVQGTILSIAPDGKAISIRTLGKSHETFRILFPHGRTAQKLERGDTFSGIVVPKYRLDSGIVAQLVSEGEAGEVENLTSP